MPVYTTVSLMMSMPDIGSNTTITSAHFCAFAEEAESEINARIAKTYALPISGPIPLLQTLATDFAIYKTLSKRLYSAERMKGTTWPDRYKEIVETLKEIADGKLAMVDSSGAVIGARTDLNEVWSNNMDYPPTFHEGPIGDSVQYSDKIENELDRRDL